MIALASFSEGKQIDKIKSAALLSPVAYLSHMTTALGVVAARAFVSEVSTKSKFVSFIQCIFIYPSNLTRFIHLDFLDDLYGFQRQQITTIIGLAEFNPRGYLLQLLL